MKVLWLSHLIPYPPKGGVLQRTFNMIREISRYHDVTLVAFNQSGFLAASLPGVDDPLDLARRALVKSVKSLYVLDIPENTKRGGRYFTALRAFLSGRAYNMEWLKSEDAKRQILDLLSVEVFDVVHIDTVSLCVYADLFKGLPVVLNHHNFESAMLDSRSRTERNPIKSLFYKIEAARLLNSEVHHCQRSQLNLTCSEDDAEAMAAVIGGGRFVSVPNGVDVSYFYPSNSVEVAQKSIVIVGGLSWYPNREAVEYFMREIWPMIRSRIPGVRVDIIGRGPTTEMLKLAATDESFHVHGFVDDVREYLWGAQFYLCPIRTGGGTKLKILDALASGCCIIADPFACKGIDVDNGVNVVFAETPLDYVDAMQALLDNPENELRMREAGPKLIRDHYSYTTIGRQYSDELEALVTQSRHLERNAQ